MNQKVKTSNTSKKLLIIIQNLISKEQIVKTEEIEKYKDEACKICACLPDNISGKDTEDLFLQSILCWSLFQAYKKRKGIFASEIPEQKSLEKKIYHEAIFKNKNFLSYLKNRLVFLPEAEKNTIYTFVSFFVFIPVNSIMGPDFLDYHNQINCAILNQVYFESLNNQLSWAAPGKDGKPQHYIWKPISKDDFEKRNILPACISLDQACSWVHLNYVLSQPMEESAIDCFSDYHEYTPNKEYAFDQLLKLNFNEEYKAKAKNERAKIAKFVFDELHAIWLGNTSLAPKPAAMEYYELYPGYVYCLYKLIPEFDKNTFYSIFPEFQKATGLFEQMRFSAFKVLKGIKLPSPLAYELGCILGKHEGIKSEELIDFINSYPESETSDYMSNFSQLPQLEKFFLLACMFYFLLWDFAAEWHEFIPSDDKSENLGFAEHTKLMEDFFAPFLDKSWMKTFSHEEFEETRKKLVRIYMNWTEIKVIQKLLNSVLEKYHCNGSLSVEELDKSNPQIIQVIIYNLSNFKNRDRNSLLSMMDFVGEQRCKVELYVQPKKDKKYDTYDEADKERELMDKKQEALREEIDKGFELNFVRQHPVPDYNYTYFRKMTCKFFNDTDKIYIRKSKSCDKKQHWKIDCKEKYRVSNSNNLYTHYLYCAERNTERHYSSFSALNSVLNDAYPKNLLFAFIDARDFLILQKEEKKAHPEEVLQLDYLLHLLGLLLNIFVSKFNLIKSEDRKGKSIWDLLYTNNKKELKVKLPQNMDYQETLGNQYLFDLKRLFNFLYCVKSDFLETYYNEISVYLIYLAMKIDAFDMTALENN